MENKVTVNLPDIGEGVVEAEVVEWLKNVGDSLLQDEPVVVVMTDKVTVELPSPYPGKLARCYYQAGEVAKLDLPLYDIELESKGAISDLQHEKVRAKVPEIAQKEEYWKSSCLSSTQSLAVPAVRSFAKELGVVINEVIGTGKDGRVTLEDLKIHKNQLLAMIPRLIDDEERPLIGIQSLMAKKMSESKRLIPHFSFFEKVNATRLIKMRESLKKEGIKENIQVTYMPFFIRALSLTINKYPIINSSFDSMSNTLLLHKQQNMGVAMSGKRGLVVPVLKAVQELDLNGVIRSYANLKRKAESETLSVEDMKNATITLSNYGVFVGEGAWATPIISFPESAILALNKIQKCQLLRIMKLLCKMFFIFPGVLTIALLMAI